MTASYVKTTASDVRRRSTLESVGRSIRLITSNVGATAGVIMLLILLVIGISSESISPYDPLGVNPRENFRPPSWMHLFGTDEIGRDVFSRVIAGTRISLKVVLIVLAVAASIGVPLGAIAGYWGGIVDEVIMRFADIFISFPSFILALAISASLGRSLENAILSVGIVTWPSYARLIRGEVLSAKNELYVVAARSIGASELRIIFRHILPNTIAPLIIQLTMNAGVAILATAGLSFVGIGAQPPSPEWGAMVANSRQFITTHWWIPVFPSLAISFTVAAYMFLGDGLRDILDPRLNYLLAEKRR